MDIDSTLLEQQVDLCQQLDVAMQTEESQSICDTIYLKFPEPSTSYCDLSLEVPCDKLDSILNMRMDYVEYSKIDTSFLDNRKISIETLRNEDIHESVCPHSDGEYFFMAQKLLLLFQITI